MEKAILSWSGGKDAAMALEQVLKKGTFQVAALLTTVTKDYDRISMHGVRRQLLEKQAEALGLPLEIVMIPKDANNQIYEQRMEELLLQYKEQGVNTVIFGDLFLEDIRQYREDQLARVGMKGFFPLWKEPIDQVVGHFLKNKYQAITVCVDSERLPKEFVGQAIDEAFFKELPTGVDPCGENGEFHTFVYDAPTFKAPINIEKGEIQLRDERFYFCDLLPEDEASDQQA